MTAHLAEAHPMWLPHFQDGPVVASEEGGNVHMARHVHPFYFTSWFNEQLMMDFISSLPSNDSTKRQMALLRDMAFKLNFTPPKKKSSCLSEMRVTSFQLFLLIPNKFLNCFFFCSSHYIVPTSTEKKMLQMWKDSSSVLNFSGRWCVPWDWSHDPCRCEISFFFFAYLVTKWLISGHSCHRPRTPPPP